MAIDAGSAKGKLTLDASNFFSSIQTALSELQSLKTEAEKSSDAVDGFSSKLSGIGDSLQTLGGKISGVGTTLSKYITVPLTGIGIYSVKTSMTFEKAMSQVQATMGATKDDMVDLEEAAKNMGATTQYTSIEAAQALNYLALAGYNEEQMIAALPYVLNLAAAGNMDLAEASDMLTDGLSALNLTSKDSTELMANMEMMVDQMARTASRSNTSVAQLGDSILTVGGTATYLSGGLAEVNQVIGLLADRGIKASEAGTHLRNIILAMNPTTDDAKEAFKKVGLAVEDAEGNFENLAYDAEGNMKPLAEIFEILRQGMKTMTDMEKQQVLADIFHRTDLAAANALIGTSIERWQELGDEIENSAGAGSQMASTQLDNLSGQMTLLKSKIDAMATTIGEKLAPVISDVVEWIGELVDKFSKLDPETQEFIIKAGLIAAALGPVLKILGTLVSLTGTVVKAFVVMFTTLKPVVTAGVKALLAPATLGLGTVLAGIGAFLAGYGIGTMIYDAIGPEIDEVLHPIFDFFVDLWNDIVSFFTETIPGFFSYVWDRVSDFFISIKETIVFAFESAWTAVKKVWETVVGFFESIWEGIKFVFSYVGEFFKNVFTGAWEGIKKAWKTVVEFFEGIWQGISNAFSAVGEFFKGIFTEAWENIKKAWNSVISWFEGIWEGISNAFSSVGEFFSGVFSEAWSNIKKAWNGVKEFFQGIWDDIKQVFGHVVTFFKTAFSLAWEGIKTVWNKVGEFFITIWDNIKKPFIAVAEWFQEKFNAAVDAIKGAFEGIGEFFEEVWNTITKPFRAIGEFFSDLFGGDEWNPVINAQVNFTGDMSGFSSKFATGGIVDKPTRAIVGEDGREAIIPLENNKAGLKEIANLILGEMNKVAYTDYQAMMSQDRSGFDQKEYRKEGASASGDTYIFNSPEPIDEAEAARELKRVKQELAEGF